ncbi:hypothetical protein D3C85_1913430 [compost metagenome]
MIANDIPAVVDKLYELGLLFDTIPIHEENRFSLMLFQNINERLIHLLFLWTVIKR